MRISALTWRQRLAAIAGGALLATGVAVVSLNYGFSEATQRARAATLATAGDDELVGHFRTWASDDGELTVLLNGLRDERPAVARAAGLVLQETLSHWRLLRSDASSAKVAGLAHELAAGAAQFSPVGQVAASAVAQQLLAWPLDGSQVDPLLVYADCDTVLRTAAAQPHDLLLAVAIDRAPADAGMMIGRRQAAASEIEIGPVAALPGGGLPWEAAELPPNDSAPPAATPAAEAPAVEQPFAAPGEIYAPLATPLEALEGKERLDDRTARGDDRAGPLRRTSKTSIEDCDDWTLMQQLHSASTGTAAEVELRRRGFNAYTLELARCMTDADPQVRRELAERLPSAAHIDPQPWLLQLTRDRNAEVRSTAISILASSNDPSVTRWLELLRENERDTRVSARIEDLLRRR